MVSINDFDFVGSEVCIEEIVVMKLRVVFQLENFKGFFWFEGLRLRKHHGKSIVFLDFATIID